MLYVTFIINTIIKENRKERCLPRAHGRNPSFIYSSYDSRSAAAEETGVTQGCAMEAHVWSSTTVATSVLALVEKDNTFLA
jgi:hypothetical protein